MSNGVVPDKVPKLPPREAFYPFRPYWYKCRRNFGTISGTPSFELEFDLKVKWQGKDHGWLRCSGKLAVVWDHFVIPANVILGRYPVPSRLTLNLIFKVKCQVKSHGYISCSEKLAIVSHRFFTPAKVISGRCSVSRRFILNLTWEVKC